ncbi:MAG: hypothetical protein J6J26_04695 [Bacteroides sp.]|nr:hypothetical protein [Bacteroides sp.]
MKRKNLFYVMAASLAFTACADEEFATKTQPIDNGMVDVEDIDMVFTKETGDTESRALWTENANKSLSFNWEKGDKIGLVYVGQGGKVGLTNYEFESDSLQLPSYKAKSGQTRWTGFFQVNENISDVQTAYTDKDGNTLAALPSSSTSAKFATQYDAIMKGYYVTYHPYNTEYKNAGEAIPVTAPKRYNTDANGAAALDSVAKYTFSYSSPAEVKAGKQSTQFNLKNLTSVIRLRIANEANGANDTLVKSVVLRTKGNDMFTIKGSLVDPSAAASASNITVAADGQTSTLFADYKAGSYLKLKKQQTVPATGSQGDTLDVYFPILPVMFNESAVEVIIIKQDNMACVVESNFKAAGQTLPAGSVVNLYAKVTADTKFDQSFVTTSDELQQTINACKAATTATTINLLGDVESTNLQMNDANTGWNKGGVIINGSKGSKLILKGANINLFNGDQNNAAASLTINAPVTIDGGNIAGNVTVDDATVKGTVNVGSPSNNGHLTIAGDATIEKNGKITGTATGTVTIASGATLTVKEGAQYVNANKLNINGTMTVAAGAEFEDSKNTAVGATGKLAVAGTATIASGSEMTCAGGTIEVSGTLTNEGNIKVASGTLKLTGKIYNKYSLNCAGTFENSGTFYDYVGSVYGGKPFTSDGIYACYVNSQNRLVEAVARLNLYAADKYQQVLLQPMVSGAYDFGKIDAAKAAKLNVVNEVNSTATTTKITGEIYIGGNYTGCVAVNSLTVNGYSVTVGQTTTNVVNTIEIAGNINFAGATIGTTAVAPITIGAQGKLVIPNNLTVKANGAIVNAGTFDLQNAAGTQLPATVYCTEADVTKGTWTNYPIITSSENFWN